MAPGREVQKAEGVLEASALEEALQEPGFYVLASCQLSVVSY